MWVPPGWATCATPPSHLGSSAQWDAQILLPPCSRCPCPGLTPIQPLLPWLPSHLESFWMLISLLLGCDLRTLLGLSPPESLQLLQIPSTCPAVIPPPPVWPHTMVSCQSLLSRHVPASLYWYSPFCLGQSAPSWNDSLFHERTSGFSSLSSLFGCSCNSVSHWWQRLLYTVVLFGNHLRVPQVKERTLKIK